MEEIQDLNEILRVRRDKLAEMQREGRDPFRQVSYNVTNNSVQITDGYDCFEGKTVSLAGRLMSKRVMGKASFCDVHDRYGKIQAYVRMDEVGEECYEEFKKYDIGDIVGIKGEVFKTHKGEISVKVAEITLLAKSLQPLPEKWHGLKDVDLRYRQRYVDLIVNPDVRKTFIMRSRIIKTVRNHLDRLGYIEVETPVLNTIHGGGTARPFTTHHNTLDLDMYMRIAPELYLKRLIVGGLEKVFEIGRCFRNEGISYKHNPEFTMLELYEAYTDYQGMMERAEEMISEAAVEVLGTTKVIYQGQEVDLKPPWERLSMVDAVKRHTGLDFSAIGNGEQACALAAGMGIHPEGKPTWGEVLYAVFEEHVEKNLKQPVFICDYPVEISPLTKKKPGMPMLTERFEIFILGREMGNAYTELNDPADQAERFDAQVKKREAGDEEANMKDDDFINALEYGMPPAGGLGIGIDRLVMLLTDSYSIRDVLLFPTMKPKTGDA